MVGLGESVVGVGESVVGVGESVLRGGCICGRGWVNLCCVVGESVVGGWVNLWWWWVNLWSGWVNLWWG